MNMRPILIPLLSLFISFNVYGYYDQVQNPYSGYLDYVGANSSSDVSIPSASGDLLIASGDGWQALPMSGDVTIDQTGVTTIGADKVDEGMVNWGYNTDQVGADDMPVSYLGTPTYSTVQHAINFTASTGRLSGGTVTDAGSETINISSGTGWIKATDSDVARIMFFDWSANNGVSTTTNSTQYVKVQYNGGSPNAVITNSEDWDLDTSFPLAKIINEGGTLHILNNYWWTGDGITNIIERFQAEGEVVRDVRQGGLILSVPGTRNIAVTAGKLWSRFSEFDIPAIDTSVSGTVEYYWYNGVAGTWNDSDVAQYSVLQWNNTSLATLQNLNPNWYANVWVYAEADDLDIALLYPQAQYANVATAEAESPPTTVPTHIAGSGILIGRILIKQGTDAPVEVQSAFSTLFNPAQAADHGNLAGLGDDDHTQYLLANGTRALTGNWDAGSYEVRAQTLEADVATGTAPLTIASTTLVSNLNSDLVDSTGLGTLTDTKACTYDQANSEIDCNSELATGDVESVGDCGSGACYDGSSDGGTYARLYDGDSHYGGLSFADLSDNRSVTFGDLALTFDQSVASGASPTFTTVTGDITGNAGTVSTITGLAPDTATTQATQPNITTAVNLTTVGTIGTGTWQATDVGVEYGGTGVSTLTDGGIVLGSGTAAVTVLGQATNGQLPIGSTGGDPVLATISATVNETEVTNGAGTITIGLVASPTIDGGNITGIPAGAYDAASIDGDDINSNYAGRSLTQTAAAPDTLDADAELYTYKIKFGYTFPTDADEYPFEYVDLNATMAKIYCKTIGGAVSLDLFVAGSAVNGSSIRCTMDGTLDDSLGGDTSFSANDLVSLDVTWVSDDATYVFVEGIGSYDD